VWHTYRETVKLAASRHGVERVAGLSYRLRMPQSFRTVGNWADYTFGCPEGKWTAQLDNKAWGKGKAGNLILYLSEIDTDNKYWFSVFWHNGYRADDEGLCFRDVEPTNAGTAEACFVECRFSMRVAHQKLQPLAACNELNRVSRCQTSAGAGDGPIPPVHHGGTISCMNAEESTSAELDALERQIRPELVAWWKEGPDLAAQYQDDLLKLQKQRAALARRKVKMNAALRAEERKLGAAVVRVLKTDVELRAVLLPKLIAAAKAEDKAALERWSATL
jgi:hypothetical protein